MLWRMLSFFVHTTEADADTAADGRAMTLAPWIYSSRPAKNVPSFLSSKNQGVFVKHNAPGGNKVQKAIFNFDVKVTRSLTLVSFERVSVVEYACQIWSLYFLGSKVIAKVKVDNRQTDKQTDRQINRQTGQKQYAADHSIREHKIVLTRPVQCMQNVGLKYVYSWKSCLKLFRRAWQLAVKKYVFISALLIMPSLWEKTEYQ